MTRGSMEEDGHDNNYINVNVEFEKKKFINTSLS